MEDDDNKKRIQQATEAYGKFMDALGIDWRHNSDTKETPRRVAEAFVNDLCRGLYEPAPRVVSFPSAGSSSMIIQKNIPIHSICSHHHMPFYGTAHIAYIPYPTRPVIGLSKLNRIVDHLARRPQSQEQLTQSICDTLDRNIDLNQGIMVLVKAKHTCVSMRGIQHESSEMITQNSTGMFNNADTKKEFYSLIQIE